jgi:hypothetical protein
MMTSQRWVLMFVAIKQVAGLVLCKVRQRSMSYQSEHCEHSNYCFKVEHMAMRSPVTLPVHCADVPLRVPNTSAWIRIYCAGSPDL